MKMRPVQKIFLAVFTAIALVYLLEIWVFNTCLEPAEYVATGNAEPDISVYTDHIDEVIYFQPQQEKLGSVRFELAEIPADTSEIIELQILHEGEILYRGRMVCAELEQDEWSTFSTNLLLDTSETYELRLALIDTAAPQETRICGYYEADNQIAPIISVGYARNLSLGDKALASLLVLFGYLGLSAIIIRVNSLKERVCLLLRGSASLKTKCPTVWTILYLPVACLVLELSGLEIDSSLQIIISLLCFLSAFWVQNHWDNVKALLRASPRYAAVILLLSVWTAFSLIGSRCFVYPIDGTVTVGAILLFGISVFLLLSVVLLVVRTSECFANQYVGSNPGKIPWRFILITLLTFLIGMVYYVRAFNPAISTGDSSYCMYFAEHSMHGLSDWHPAFYILWLKAIISVVPATEAVTVVQYVFFAYVMLRGLLFLYEKGMPTGVLYGIVLLTTLNCGNMVHITTIWKDIPYTLSITWLTILTAILLLGEKRRRVYIYMELAVALVWTCLFRHPGIVPFAAVSVCLLIRFRKNYKIWVSVIAAVVMVLIIKFPVYQYYEIQTDYGGGIYLGLGQDIMGVYYNGGEVSEDAAQIIEVLSEEDMAGYSYSPYSAGETYDLDITKTEFVKAYLKTFLKNPIMMTRSLLCRMDAVWDIFQGEDGSQMYVAYTDTWDERENNYFTELLSQWVAYSEREPILNVLEWRSGIYFLVFIISIGVCVCKRQLKNMMLLFVPCLSHVLSLVLSTGWSDFRYFWPINLMTLFVFTTILILKPKEEKV